MAIPDHFRPNIGPYGPFDATSLTKIKREMVPFWFLISHTGFKFWPKKQPHMPQNDKFGQLFALRPIWYFMLVEKYVLE